MTALAKARVHNASLHVLPKDREESIAHRPACHCQPADNCGPFHVLPLHEYGNLSAAASLADEAPVVIEVGEEFEEDFDRELENCSVQVRCESKQRRQEPECSLPLVWACGVR